ncbi:MAG: HD-GYP domain-containing protein [Sphingomonas sp.]
MLIRVSTDQLQIGMYVASIDGSWLDHSLWRSRFLINSPAQLDKLRDGRVATVVIDDEKGIGLPAAVQSAPPEPAAEPPRAAPPRRRRRARTAHLADHALSRRPCSAEEEAERATAIVNRSKQAVKAMFDDIRLGKAVTSGALLPVVDEISSSVARNPYALIGIARLKTKDEYTYLHSVAVCALMVNLARHLALDEALTRDIGMAGLLHDVGKMTVPAELLHKPGALTPAEFAIVKHHAIRGYEMLRDSGSVPDIALDVCLHHHERVDGTGYPHNLAGDAISLYARMGAVCDVYDAVTSARAYKQPWHPAEALTRMAEWHGHFDPRILAAFERSLGIYSVGTLVRLRSNRLALVIEEGEDLTRPLLRTFYSVTEDRLIPADTIRLDGIADRIVGPESPAAWPLGDWPSLKARLLDETPASRAA